MSTLSVDSSTRESHFSNGLSLFYAISSFDIGAGEVGVEAEYGAAVPHVFNDDVFSVVAVSCEGVDIGDCAWRYRVNEVERVAMAITLDGFDVDPFVKFGADDSVGGASEGADKSVFACCPWSGCFAFKNTVAIHVKLIPFGITSVNVVVNRGKCELG